MEVPLRVRIPAVVFVRPAVVLIRAAFMSVPDFALNTTGVAVAPRFPPSISRVPPSKFSVLVTVLPAKTAAVILPPTLSRPVSVRLMVAAAALFTSSVVEPIVRLTAPDRIRDPPLMFSVEVAVLTVVAALFAEFWAPMLNVVPTVVVPPEMERVAMVSLPLPVAPETVFTPMVRVVMVFVPPVMLTMAVASPVVEADEEFVARVSVPMVAFAPMFRVPVTLPVVSVDPVRAATLTVVASRPTPPGAPAATVS